MLALFSLHSGANKVTFLHDTIALSKIMFLTNFQIHTYDPVQQQGLRIKLLFNPKQLDGWREPELDSFQG